MIEIKFRQDRFESLFLNLRSPMPGKLGAPATPEHPHVVGPLGKGASLGGQPAFQFLYRQIYMLSDWII